MPRTERIEMRAEPERRQRILYAAKLSQQSVTDFVLDAALLRAEEVISASRVTTVTADFFDALWDSLAAPPVPNENLARAARDVRANPRVKQG